jgi:hypothetical protein
MVKWRNVGRLNEEGHKGTTKQSRQGEGTSGAFVERGAEEQKEQKGILRRKVPMRKFKERRSSSIQLAEEWRVAVEAKGIRRC